MSDQNDNPGVDQFQRLEYQMTKEICYMDDFFQKVGELEDKFYCALDIQSIDGESSNEDESQSEENPKKYQSYNETMDDLERRIKLYGQLDQTSKISKKIGAHKKQTEGKDTNINFYDQGDKFIDDQQQANIKGRQMTLVYAQYDDFEFFEGSPQDFAKSDLFKSRVTMLVNVMKQGMDEQKKKADANTHQQKEKDKQKQKVKQKQKQKQKDVNKQKNKSKMSDKEKDVKQKEKEKNKEKSKNKDKQKEKDKEKQKQKQKPKIKFTKEEVPGETLLQNLFKKRLPPKQSQKQTEAKKPKKKIKKQGELEKQVKSQMYPSDLKRQGSSKLTNSIQQSHPTHQQISQQTYNNIMLSLYSNNQYGMVLNQGLNPSTFQQPYSPQRQAALMMMLQQQKNMPHQPYMPILPNISNIPTLPNLQNTQSSPPTQNISKQKQIIDLEDQ